MLFNYLAYIKRRCHSCPYTLLPPTPTKHRSKSEQTLQSTEETCQKLLWSRFHNLAYFYAFFIFSVSESCCRIWSQSHHCKKVDTSLNECLRLISCCVKSTPTELLSILFGIEPMDIRRNKNIPSLCIRVMENTHIFHQTAILHLQVVDSKVEHHYQLVCTV